MKELWRAVHNLGNIFKNDTHVKEYSRIILALQDKSSESQIKEALSEFIAKYNWLKSQPFLMGWNFCQLYSEKRIHDLNGGVEFCRLSEVVALKIHYIIEWLRSLLPRYPDLLVPHVVPNSNKCGQEFRVLHLFPWLNHIFHINFKPKNDFLSHFQNHQKSNHHLRLLDQLLVNLATKLMNTDAWHSFKKIADELGDEDVANLTILVNEFQENTEKNVVTNRVGKKLIRIAKYKSLILNDIITKADDKLKVYYKSFEDVEWLLQIVNYLLSSLAIYGPANKIQQYNTFIVEQNQTSVSEKFIKLKMNFSLDLLRFLRIGQVLYFENELSSFEGAIVTNSYSLGMNEIKIGGYLLKNSRAEF